MQKHESRGGDIQLLSCIQATSIFAHKHKRYLPPLRREKINILPLNIQMVLHCTYFSFPLTEMPQTPCHFYHCHRITSTASYLIFMTFIYQYLYVPCCFSHLIFLHLLLKTPYLGKTGIPFLSAAWHCCLPQCGNFRIFLSFRFYVKLILKDIQVVNLPILPFKRL